MVTLKDAVQDTIGHLRESEESVWSHRAPNEIIRILESELQKSGGHELLDLKTIALLFAPTGDIQEISMTNGWSDEYLEISQVVDTYTKRKVYKE